MDNNNTKRSFIIYSTLFNLLMGIIGATILNVVLPGHYFSCYPVIPIFFYLFSLLSIQLFEMCRQRAPQKMLMLYLAIKVLKIILSLILLLIFCVIAKTEAREFLLTFVVYYVLYLIYETLFFVSYEKNRKKNNINKNETVA